MLLREPAKPPTTLLENRWSLGLEYQIVREIGHGSYGKVFEAIETKTSRRVAIKKFVSALTHAKLAQYCLREIEILSKLRHPNIVTMLKALRSENSVYIVMEYMPLDLRKLIHSPSYLTIGQIKSIMYELAIGLNYLHSGKIVHRDIKPGNILITQDCKVKLCDFGLARSICGLSITAYDFDEIYRREFAESNDAGLVPTSTKDEDMPEDLDEHANIHTELTMPGYFAVDMDKVKAQVAPVPLPKRLLEVKESAGIGRVASCDVVPEPKLKVDEELKGDTAKPLGVTARRAAFIQGLRPDPRLERELTSHIASRWYRAPEVILLEKVYCSAVDMWGLGCVFAELLQMRKGNRAIHKDRKALFPGTSCFPLSPQQNASPSDGAPFPPGDQLITICRVLGSPSEDDISFINDPSAKQYASMLPKARPNRLKELLPDTSEEELALLQRLLTFNPFQRITAKEVLRHDYFKSVRNKEREIEGQGITFENDTPDSASIQKLTALCIKL